MADVKAQWDRLCGKKFLLLVVDLLGIIEYSSCTCNKALSLVRKKMFKRIFALTILNPLAFSYKIIFTVEQSFYSLPVLTVKILGVHPGIRRRVEVTLALLRSIDVERTNGRWRCRGAHNETSCVTTAKTEHVNSLIR